MGFRTNIVWASLTVLICTLFSRVAGLFREAAIAYRFGATGTTDAFLVAYSLPYFFYNVIGLAMAAVIIPLFSELTAEGSKDQKWQMLNLLLNTLLVLTVLGTLLCVMGAPLVVRVLAGGLDPAYLAAAENLTVQMMPSLIFMTLAGLLSGTLNANGIFGTPALGPGVMNMAIIMAALIAAPLYGVQSLVIGTLLGTVLFVAIQIRPLIRLGYRYRFLINLGHPWVRRVAILMWPVMLVSGITQIYTFIDLHLASGLGEGSISALNYARKLMQLPQGLFVTAVSTAIFPTLSQLVVRNKSTEMAETLQKGLKLIMFFAIPGSVGLIILREPIVSLIFQRGAFNQAAAALTSHVFLFYALGFIGLCIHLPLTRGFFAFNDTRTPLIVAGISLGTKFVLSLILVNLFQNAGLALATSLAVLLNSLLLLLLLQRRLPNLITPSFGRYILIILGISLTMGVIVSGADRVGELLFNGKSPLIFRVAFDITVGGVSFLTMAYILLQEGTSSVVEQLKNLARKKAVSQ